MTDDRSLENMSLKELGALAVSLDLAHWSRLRKAELIDAIRGKLKSQKKAAKSQRRVKGSASKKSASSSRQPTLFDVEDEAPASERSRKKTKRGEFGASSAQKSAVETPAPKKSRGAKSKEAPSAESSEQEEPSAVKKTRRISKKAESVPTKESIAAVPKRSRGKKAEVAADDGKSEEPRKKRGRKSALAAPEPEPAQAASKRRKSAVGKIEEAEKQPAKRRGRQTKAAVEEASKLAVKEKPIESAKKSKKTRKAEPVESAPAKSEPVQESVSAEEPVKKRRTRRSAEKKAEKQVELETEVEADALAEIEAEERSAEEKKPRKSRKSKLAKAEQPSLSDYELWNWDDEEEDEAANSDANSDDEFDDFDFDDDASAVASAASDSKPEPEPEPEPEPVASPPSQEAIALKEKMRRQKFIGTDHDRVDRLLLMVCDSYWLRACWEITPLLIDRVRSAMGRHWHTAEPVLRVFLVDAETKSAATHREHVLDLEIRGGIDNWYVPVENPPSSFMVELGYRSRDGQFFTLISSNVVKTPQRFVHDAFGRLNVGPEPNSSSLEPNGAHTGQREPFDVKASASRPELDPSAASFGRSSPFNRVPSSSFWSDGSDVKFTVDAEIVIKGRVAPGSSVSVKDEHIRLRPDGTFSVRYSLPERRHVFPVVATSSDGIETQTIVLAVDRNTKTLDPVFKEDEED